MKEYVDLLIKWNKVINLISHNTLDEIWERHILDCQQLIKFIDPEDMVVDIGSGAGLPGIVLSMSGVKNVTLVESDKRKAAFLLQASRLSPNKVTVINKRIEDLEIECDILTARAFASINDILRLSSKIFTKKKILLLKGERVETELIEASKNWEFDYKLHSSETDSSGWIVELRKL